MRKCRTKLLITADHKNFDRHKNMQFMSSNAEQIIPQGEIRRFSMGGVHTDVLEQIFGEWPTNFAEKDDDPRRSKAFAIVRQILHSYYHEHVFDRFVFEGYVDGLTHMDRLLSFYSYENAVNKAHFLVHERLSLLNHIEAVFFTSGEAGDCQRKRVNQTGKPVTENESYVFALREGLKYGLLLSLAQTGQEYKQPDAAKFYTADLDFIMNEQPRMSVKHVDRLHVPTCDACANGLKQAVEFIRIVSMVEVWNRHDKSLYNPISDPFCNRFKRILTSDDLQVLFVKALRANKQMFHLFRLGCGNESCVPAVGNFVFYLDVPAHQVPSCHIAALLHPLEIVTENGKIWIK